MAKSRRKVLYRVIISHRPHATGLYKYSAEVPALPGCFSDGRTRKEAIRNIQKVIRERLTPLRPRRSRKDVEMGEVAVG